MPNIVKNPGGDEPDPVATKRVVQRAYGSGLVLLSCGTSANTIRILVPLTAEDAIVDEGSMCWSRRWRPDGR